jgi:DinB superfamily
MQTPYREGGWTVAQVVHHFADSHLHAYLRMRLALTERSPLVPSYDRVEWAELPDARLSDVTDSLDLVEALHRRWVTLLRALSPQQFERDIVQPDRGSVTVDRILAIYAWHSRHHVAHIVNLRDRNGWLAKA